MVGKLLQLTKHPGDMTDDEPKTALAGAKDSEVIRLADSAVHA